MNVCMHIRICDFCTECNRAHPGVSLQSDKARGARPLWQSIDRSVSPDALLDELTVSISLVHCTGSIPSRLAELENLQMLVLHNNSLTGSIPSTFGGLLKLEGLSLNDNRLTGSVPQSIRALTALKELSLTGNEHLQLELQQ